MVVSQRSGPLNFHHSQAAPTKPTNRAKAVFRTHLEGEEARHAAAEEAEEGGRVELHLPPLLRAPLHDVAHGDAQVLKGWGGWFVCWGFGVRRMTAGGAYEDWIIWFPELRSDYRGGARQVGGPHDRPRILGRQRVLQACWLVGWFVDAGYICACVCV